MSQEIRSPNIEKLWVKRLPVSSFGFGNCSWRAPFRFCACIGTMNVEQVGQCRQQGAADVSSAELFSDFSAGKMPAAPCGSWKETSDCLMPRSEKDDSTARVRG